MYNNIEDINSQIEIQEKIVNYEKSNIHLIDQFLLDLKYSLKKFLKEEIFYHFKNYDIEQKYKTMKDKEKDIQMKIENQDKTFYKAFQSLFMYQNLIIYCLEILDQPQEDEKLYSIQYDLIALNWIISKFQNMLSTVLSKKSDDHTQNFQQFQQSLDEKVNRAKKIYGHNNSLVELFENISENWKQISDELDKNFQGEDQEESNAECQEDYIQNIQEIQQQLNQLNE